VTVALADLHGMQSTSGLTEAELARLLEVAPPRDFEAGWPIYEEGKPVRCCLLLVRGEVEVRKRVGGRDRHITNLHKGVLLGQSALIDRSHRLVSVHATTDVTALALDRTVWRRLLNALDPLAVALQRQDAVAGIRQLRAATLAVHRVANRLDRHTSADVAFQDSRESAAHATAALHEWSVDLQRLIESDE